MLIRRESSTETPPAPRPVVSSRKGRKRWTLRFWRWRLALRQRLNWRLLAATLGVLFVAGTAAHFWHALQLRRNADAILARAAAFEEKEQWQAAADHIYRYLQLKPGDAGARIRLAKTFYQTAKSKSQQSRAAVLLADALTLDDSALPPAARHQLRESYARLLLELENYGVAESQADLMLRHDEESASAWMIKALALEGRFQQNQFSLSDASPVFDGALARNPADWKLAVRLAEAYRAAKQDSAADSIMNRLLEQNPEMPRAHLAGYQYRTRYELPGADACLDQALVLDLEGKDADICLAAAERALKRKQPEEAKRLFERLIRIDSRDSRGYVGLSRAQSAGENHRQALETCRAGLKKAGEEDILLLYQEAEALLNLGQTEELKAALEKVDARLVAMAPYLMPRYRIELGAQLVFLRAQQALRERDYYQAARHLLQVLETIKSGPTSSEQVARQTQIYWGMGTCYAALKQWDRAAMAFQQASSLNPHQSAFKLAAADAWLSAGQFESAIAYYADVVSAEDAPSQAWPAFARALFLQQVATPASKRNWQLVQQTLVRAQAENAESFAAGILTAELAAAQRRFDEAVELLRGLEVAPEFADRQEQFALAYDQWGRREEADRVLANLEKAQGKGARWLLLKAALLTARRDFESADHTLAAAISIVPPEKRAEIEHRRCLLHLSAGKTRQARSELAALSANDPNNASLLQLLADLAYESHDFADLENWEAKLEALEGPDGTLWRFYRALHLGTQAKDLHDPLFAEALRHMADLGRLRPAWGPTYLLKGRLEHLQRNYEEAIKAYERAVQLGERRLHIYEQLVRLLFTQNRIADADQYLSRLSETTASSAQLSQLAINIGLKQGDVRRALDAAREGVKRRPADPFAHIWLGQTLHLDKQNDQAEAAFRKATELAPDDTRSWAALLSFCLITGKRDEARRALDALQQTTGLKDAERDFVLAQGYDMLGDRAAAEPLYRKTMAASPDRPAVWQRAALFFYATQPDESMKCLQQVLKLEPSSTVAKRLLASLMATRQLDSDESEIWKLLDEPGADGAVDLANLRFKAVLLVRQGGQENLAQAESILTTLLRNPRVATDRDRLALARLHELQGRPISAREQYLALVLRSKPSASHLAALVDHLLRYERAHEATDWLAELAKVEPPDLHLRVLDLKVRWLHARGRTAEVVPLVHAFLEKQAATNEPAQQAEALLNVSRLLTACELNKEAEEVLRCLAGMVPWGYRSLAAWLATHEGLDEALRLCLQAAETDATSAAAITLASVLTLAEVEPGSRSAADAALDRALQKHSADARLLFAVATWHQMRGNKETAVALLRRALRLEPLNVQTLNNLAMALAPGKSKESAEALEAIDRAIRLAGSSPALLDTKGWVLFHQGGLDDAETLLSDALTLPPVDPRSYFHLALVYWRKQDSEKARSFLELARKNQLPINMLSRPERELLELCDRDLHSDASRNTGP